MAEFEESYGLAHRAAFEESAEELYEEAPCGYLSTDPDGRIVRVNRTLLRWTGYTEEQLVGQRRFVDLLTAGGRIYHETHYAPLLRMQGSVREIALDLRCADGANLPMLVNSTTKNDAAGRPLVVRTMLFDARHRREYERELLRARERAEGADRAKAEFISMVSHEIRTPLGAIMAVGHLLETTEPSERQQKYLRILRSSAENLHSLINDILDFSRSEAGKLELDERPFELRPLLQEIVTPQRVRVEQRGVDLVLEVAESCPEHLIGDRVKIGQILTNLIGNAVKFTEAGSIRVEAVPWETDEGSVTLGLTVSDTGIGISPDRLPHIFDAFTQASPEVSSKYGGTGLGLAITKRLVELHGGELRVESEVGRGSVFRCGLRLRRAAPTPTAEAAAAAAEEAPLRGLRVLVADDNEVNVVVMVDLLRGWGATTDIARDGSEAVDRCRSERYDAVLMDLRMPKMDGYRATREIRGGPGGAELPIIAVSASMRMGESVEVQEGGFTDFVGKPIRPDLLLQKLGRWVREAG
ncbi:MAG TPA: ATP-binding protein [Thermoanaerobaculia bacterium]|nr:ATP-binding protein [Thermoanaerobaculia bacterium]